MARSVLPMLALLLFVAPATAHQTVYGHASTGSADTWGITSNVPPMCQDGKIALPCLSQPCPDDIYWFTVTLTLIDPSPLDVVTLTVAGDPPGLQGGATLYPTDVATANDPVAQVKVQLGGCNRATTALVNGVFVDGEVRYELRY